MDLVAEQKELTKKQSDEVKKLEALALDAGKYAPRSREVMVNFRDQAKSKAVLESIAQRSQYLEIAVARRRLEVSQEYSRAFDKDEPWPNPKDVESHRALKKLRSAPRTWMRGAPTENRYSPKEEQ
jgi:hypothetical protein